VCVGGAAAALGTVPRYLPGSSLSAANRGPITLGSSKYPGVSQLVPSSQLGRHSTGSASPGYNPSLGRNPPVLEDDPPMCCEPPLGFIPPLDLGQPYEQWATRYSSPRYVFV
jgi:hypothetical protein